MIQQLDDLIPRLKELPCTGVLTPDFLKGLSPQQFKEIREHYNVPHLHKLWNGNGVYFMIPVNDGLFISVDLKDEVGVPPPESAEDILKRMVGAEAL